ncbi:MAG: hypothetical protein H7249_10620 [Chitinophagaceae bacterium]|nr:hypothetical protein [Oligoflexus sp.]
MKWLASALIASVLLPSVLQAKGLDKLGPETEETEADKKDGEGIDKAGHEHNVKSGDGKDVKGSGKDEEDGDKEKAKTDAKPVEVKKPEVPVEPGFQQAYLGTSLSIIGVSGSTGTWHSSTTGDLEGGYRLLKGYQGRWDVYGTIRYRPADLTVEKNQRAYRGISETYLFGAKAQTEIRPKLFAVASAELGRSKAALYPIDGEGGVDGELEKSGVDLSLGGGVSYLVLDKIALGTQIHLGLGVIKSTQFGVDLRFLL